jgi:hypothetical protein
MQVVPGSLREQVKRGELTPRQVLVWLRKQSYQNPRFKMWLLRRHYAVHP